MSYISAGTTTTTSLIQGGDITGNLVIATGNANTTALTISATQNATFANNVSVAGNITVGNIINNGINSVTGNVTGGNVLTGGIMSSTGNAVHGNILTSGAVSATGSITSVNTFGFKNRFINGDMRIDQRNAGASITQSTSTTYTLDRWACYGSVASKFTVQQNAGSITPPAGFINYLGCTSSSAYTVGAGEYFSIIQKIEGFNMADLGYGTANAKTITFSFWVYSSLTGTFGGALKNANGTRSYPYSYTISSANTWTQISLTIVGDTTGTWTTSSATGMEVWFSLGTGSTYSGTAGAWAGANYTSATGATSVVGTSGATFYITGVQLEVGSQATSFDFRDYGRELLLCQRYYQYLGNGTNDSFGPGVFVNASTLYGFGTFIVTLRSTPTIGYSALADFSISSGTAASNATAISDYGTKNDAWSIQFSGTGVNAANQPGFVRANSSSSKLTFSSEL